MSGVGARMAAGVLGLCLAASAAVTPAVASEQYTVPTDAITWTVDHAAKTITVVVKLQVYVACGNCPWSGTEGGRSLENQFLVDKIREGIERIWNKGNRYRCYTLVFHVDIELGGDAGRIKADRIGVAVDYSAVPIRSNVKGIQAAAGTWESNDPAQRVTAVNDHAEPSTWAGDARKTTFAHEFGHLIGLHDTYDHVTGHRYPDAPDDLMSTYGNEDIKQENVDRVVERSRDQLVDKTTRQKMTLDDLRCDYSLDLRATWSGTPLADNTGGRIDVEATATITGLLLTTADGKTWTGSGTLTTDVRVTRATLAGCKARLDKGTTPAVIHVTATRGPGKGELSIRVDPDASPLFLPLIRLSCFGKLSTFIGVPVTMAWTLMTPRVDPPFVVLDTGGSWAGRSTVLPPVATQALAIRTAASAKVTPTWTTP